MKLVIDRATWLRGEGSEDSYLYRQSDEKKCCIGFYCLVVGLDIQRISGYQLPEYLFTGKDNADVAKLDRLLERKDTGAIVDSEICGKLVSANDSERISDLERELKIAELFAQIDVEVEFV